jgi:sialate O-acetylesterase
MKYNKIFTLFTLFAVLPILSLKAEVRTPRFISDGMVLQRNETVRIWGTADPGEKVTVTFLKKKYVGTADAEGNWMVYIPTTKKNMVGGPYTMTINERKLSDIYVGDVWLCSGQSNMDLHTARLVDLYKDEFDTDVNPAIHLMQTGRNPSIKGQQDDIDEQGSYPWESMSPDKVGHWSGIGYFFAKEMFKRSGGVPQGIINCSMGGSDIVAWIPTDLLRENAPRHVQTVEHLKQPGYLERCAALNRVIGQTYNQLLEEDPGLKGQWMQTDLDDSDWEIVNQYDPHLGDADGRTWVGTLWFRKEFNVPQELVGKDSLLRLGCLVDADVAYLNGVKVGEITYQYPPRKYTLPAGLLKAGRNVLVIKLRTNGSPEKFVKEKPYKLFFHGGKTINLEGNWRMKRGILMPRQPGVEGVNNGNASALYDNTIYPLRNYRIAGILWNQGETNAGRPDEYRKLLPVLIEGWRRDFGNVPAVIFGLANYMERHPNANFDGGWAKIRESQRLGTQALDKAGFVTAIDLGEWNDIHPLNKKESARRAALWMQRLYLGDTKEVVEGPAFESIAFSEGKAIITFKPGTADGLILRSGKPHSKDNPGIYSFGFSIAGEDGIFQWCEAMVINDNQLLLWNDRITNPVAVRYAWDDDPIVTLYNGAGLPAPSFSTK